MATIFVMATFHHCVKWKYPDYQKGDIFGYLNDMLQCCKVAKTFYFGEILMSCKRCILVLKLIKISLTTHVLHFSSFLLGVSRNLDANCYFSGVHKIRYLV